MLLVERQMDGFMSKVGFFLLGLAAGASSVAALGLYYYIRMPYTPEGAAVSDEDLSSVKPIRINTNMYNTPLEFRPVYHPYLPHYGRA